MTYLLPERSLSTLDHIHCIDALSLLRGLGTGSVDAVITDPPYNGVKEDAWDNQWKTDADYLAWLRALLVEFRRVLKPNGSLYLFASPKMAARVIDVMERGDWLGLGGWCVLGIFQRVAALQECFRQTINRVIPYAARRGVKRAHIFGVVYPDALGKLLHIAHEYGIEISTDSMSPSLAPTRGQWGYGEWRDNNHVFAPLELRGLERAEHVRLTRDWLARLDKTPWYTTPKDKRVMVQVSKPEQLRMAI